MLGGWGDDVAAAAAPVHVLQQPGAVAGAGGREVVVQTAAGVHQRPQKAELVLGGPAAQRRTAGRPVDVEDVGELAGDQADVGLRPAPPPPRELVGVAGGVVEAMGGAGVFADRAAAQVAARAANLARLPLTTDRNRVVERQDPKAAGGVGQRGVQEGLLGGHGGCSPLSRGPLVVRNSRSSSRP
jgi:hypothetical protein